MYANQYFLFQKLWRFMYLNMYVNKDLGHVWLLKSTLDPFRCLVDTNEVAMGIPFKFFFLVNIPFKFWFLKSEEIAFPLKRGGMLIPFLTNDLNWPLRHRTPPTHFFRFMSLISLVPLTDSTPWTYVEPIISNLSFSLCMCIYMCVCAPLTTTRRTATQWCR